MSKLLITGETPPISPIPPAILPPLPRSSRPQKPRLTSAMHMPRGPAGHLQAMHHAMPRCLEPRPPPTLSLPPRRQSCPKLIYSRFWGQLSAARPQKPRLISHGRLTLGPAGHLQAMHRAMPRCLEPRPPPTPSLLQRCQTRHRPPYARFQSQLHSATRPRRPPAPRSALRQSHSQ